MQSEVSQFVLWTGLWQFLCLYANLAVFLRDKFADAELTLPFADAELTLPFAGKGGPKDNSRKVSLRRC